MKVENPFQRVSVLFTHLFSILHVFVFVHDSVLVVRVRRAGVT